MISWKQTYILLLLLALIALTTSEAVLAGLPVTFTMSGNYTGTPDVGGALQNYCVFTVGYVGRSWLGIQFVNSGATSDFLALQISDFYTDNGNVNTGHQITYTDYFKTNGALFSDTLTSKDINSYSYSLTKAYSLQIKKYVGSNNGEDWDGQANKYSVQQICFYSSSISFDPTDLTTAQSACFFYEIDSYVSTFVGQYLKSFILNGYNTTIYGYIDGPVVANKLYFYHNTPLFTYVKPPAVVLEIGTTSGNYGQDYYAWSSVTSECGDYYGASLTQMALDNNAGGFQNPALTLNHWNSNTSSQISGLGTTSLRISFSRAVYTYDPYDKEMLSTFLFCMYLYSSGSINGALSDKGCEVVQISPVYVQMGLTTSYQKVMSLTLLVIVLMMSFI